jgi:hypothetical protein
MVSFSDDAIGHSYPNKIFFGLSLDRIIFLNNDIFFFFRLKILNFFFKKKFYIEIKESGTIF